MHIKRIHDMVEKLTKCTEMELEKGIENVDTEEMGEVVDMIKDLCEAEYYAKVSKAMDEHDFDNAEEIMDEGRRGYRGQPRDSRGRYMRRGYDEMMYMPEMYRDMDLMDGKMYYTSANRSQGSQGQSNGGSSMGSSHSGSMGYSDGMMRDSREGRSGQSRKGYVETKEMHKGNSEEDKMAKKRELDKWMNDIGSDVKELVHDMTPEEKTMAKTKLTNLANSL